MEQLNLFFYILCLLFCSFMMGMGTVYNRQFRSPSFNALLTINLFSSIYILIDIVNYYVQIHLYPFSLILNIIFFVVLTGVSCGITYFTLLFACQLIHQKINKRLLLLFALIVLFSLIFQSLNGFYFATSRVAQSTFIHNGFFIPNIASFLSVFFAIALLFRNTRQISSVFATTLKHGLYVLIALMPLSVLLNVFGYVFDWQFGPLSPLIAVLLNGLGFQFSQKVALEDVSFTLTHPKDDGPSLTTLLDAYHLTPRELEIIDHLLAGRNNTEIGELLFIAGNTVKNHVSNIYKKMGVKSRYELIAKLSYALPLQ